MPRRLRTSRNRLDRSRKAARRLLLTTVFTAACLASPATLALTQEAPAEPNATVQDVEALDLDALIAELDPPSLDEILSRFDPYPGLDRRNSAANVHLSLRTLNPELSHAIDSQWLSVSIN